MKYIFLILIFVVFYNIVKHPKRSYAFVCNGVEFLSDNMAKKSKVRVISGSSQPDNKVKPGNIPLYIQKNWKQSKNAYYGYYYTNYGSWYGEIVRRADKLLVYIIDPPIKQLRFHDKWPCFHNKGRHKVWLHLHKQPRDKDIGAIIVYVEHLITESFQKYMKKPGKSSKPDFDFINHLPETPSFFSDKEWETFQRTLRNFKL